MMVCCKAVCKFDPEACQLIKQPQGTSCLRMSCALAWVEVRRCDHQHVRIKVMFAVAVRESPWLEVVVRTFPSRPRLQCSLENRDQRNRQSESPQILEVST